MGRECGHLAVRRRHCCLLLALVVLACLAAGWRPEPAAAATYRVRAGDTLSEIASAHGLSVARLARLNHLDPNGVLLAGAVLRVPSTRPPLRRYRVEPGDSLSGIAVRYGTSVATISRLNRIDPQAILLIGRVLLLPAPAQSHETVRAMVVRWAAHYGVRRNLALAVAWQESGYQPNLTSSVGAWGVMQVMPTTWDYVETVLIGRRVPRTTEGGVRVGLAYLHYLLRAFDAKERLAVAAYYQGERSVREDGILPDSTSYVANVLSLAA